MRRGMEMKKKFRHKTRHLEVTNSQWNNCNKYMISNNYVTWDTILCKICMI